MKLLSSLLFLLTTSPALWGQLWFEDLTDSLGLRHAGWKNHGIALADIDRDGDLDIYAFTRLGENQLYENLGAWQFTNIAPLAWVNHPGSSRAAVFGDINNDGWPDLYLANYQSLDNLFLNQGPDENGQIRFLDITIPSGIYNKSEPRSVNMADVDGDGWLDIYVVNYQEPNRLYRNLGDLRFEDISEEAGVPGGPFSMGSVFFDYDKDGDQDAFLTHDFLSPCMLYENDGKGSFKNVASALQADLRLHGMGVDIADIDHDGWLDVYITDLAENVLLRNEQGQGFTQMDETAGVGDPGMGWGTFFLDADNDGWQDLYVINDSHFSPEPNAFFRNLGNGRFEALSTPGPVASAKGGVGGAWGDLNGDGAPDLMVANPNEGHEVFANTHQGGNWLALHLEGSSSNRSAIGARVEIFYEGHGYQMDQLTAGSGYAGQSQTDLHFGLGMADMADYVQVHWPTGKREGFTQLAANQRHQLVEGQGEQLEETSWQIVRLFPSPAKDQVQLDLLCPTPGSLSAHLFNAQGQVLQTWDAIPLAPGSHEIPLQLQPHPGGVYFLHLSVNQIEHSIPILIQ
ncbi:MAG: FG-GAP-like repeat-containing protein [Bacteroidota bacterium]